MTNIRVGHGYDVHRLVKDRDLIIGGEKIDYEYGLLGHSDADVLLHAIMDALLGAAALGDIGRHFPDNSEEFRGISSLTLLSLVKDILLEHGYAVVNIDATVIMQKPKIAKYIPKMKENISSVLGVAADLVNVKATTEEGLGFSGEGLGVAAHAVALIEKQ